MSTKYLARTVLEGGRSRYNRFERRHSNSCERRHERVVSSLELRAGEPGMQVYPVRKAVYKGFRDKLSPAERWHGTRYLPLPEPAEALEEWLAGRRVATRGSRLYWLVPTPSGSFRQHASPEG